MSPNLVIIRHGQSQFNLENRFAGWIDTDLTAEGEAQATRAGETLKNSGFVPDVIYVSPFTRTKRTAKIISTTAWNHEDAIIEPRLAERFYGDLSGKNKTDSLAQIGDEMFLKIRRGYETQPPEISTDNPELATVNEVFNRLLKGSFTDTLPKTESLKDVEARVKPFFDTKIMPELNAGKKILIVAHGNSLRALIKLVKNIAPQHIAGVELETAQPAGFVVENGQVKSDSVGKHFAEWVAA
jgi:2,3-bisphosphoglycerate-dependent phosphoglycerate mutase